MTAAAPVAPDRAGADVAAPGSTQAHTAARDAAGAAKRVLLVTSSYPATVDDGRSSAGLFVRDFAVELAKRCELALVTQHTGAGAPVLEEPGYRVTRFAWAGADGALSNLRLRRDPGKVASVMLRGLQATVRAGRGGVDHTFAMWAIPCGLWALALKIRHGVPYSVWCLGQDVWNYAANPLTRRLLHQVLRHADGVYADGFELRDEVARIARRACSYLPSCRTLDLGAASPARLDPARRHYLFIGRYHPNKAPDLLLDAVAALAPEVRAGAHFHLFGGGPLEAELRRFAAARGLEDTVTIGGYIAEPDAVSYLRACDTVIIPSRQETISLTLSNAAKAGRSIIASDAGDMGEVLGRHRAGRVVPAGSAEALARAIEDDFRAPGDFTAGQAELSALFDVGATAERFVREQLEATT